MSNEQDSKGGEGRGLPHGWEWREDEDGFALRLYPPGCGSLDYSAVAYRDGSFVAYRDARGSEEIASEDRDDPRTPEAIAAAQAAAEAALWRCDGFGVGEARGLRLPSSDGICLGASSTLPGLHGRWRVTDVRPVEGGVEVDAVRALAVEPASAAPAPKPWREMSDAEQIDATKARARQLGFVIRDPRDYRPSPSREPSAPTDGCHAHWFGFRCNLDPGHHGEHAAGYVQTDGETGRVMWEGGSIPREPSAPTDGELARLLPGLPSALAMLRRWDTSGPCPGPTTVDKVVDACELLLAERAVLARSFGDALKREDRAFGLRVAFEQGRATERARIAELEAALAAEKEAHQACHAERVRYHDTAARLEAERLAAGATPPPHTVVALLAALNAADAEAKAAYLAAAGPRVCDVDALMRAAGKGEGLRAAAEIAKATLTPSPLDRVVAEVLACDVAAELANGEQGMLVAVDMLNTDLFHGNAAGHKVTLRKLGAIALRYIAGMLACDAAPAPCEYCRARDAGRATTARGCTCAAKGGTAPSCFVKEDSLDGDDVCLCRGGDATPDDKCACTTDPRAVVRAGEHPVCVNCGAEVRGSAAKGGA